MPKIATVVIRRICDRVNPGLTIINNSQLYCDLSLSGEQMNSASANN